MLSRKPKKLSAMHHQHLALGAAMVENDGWQRPSRYTSVEHELGRVYATVGLYDISPNGKVSVQGRELDLFLIDAFANRKPLGIGRVRKGCLSDRVGVSPVFMARLTHDEVMIVTHPNQTNSVFQALGRYPGQCVHALDITSALAGITITGPAGPLLLESLTELDTSPEEFPNMSCAQTKVAEIHGVVQRLDLGSLSNYEIYVGREYGEYLWDVLMEMGADYDVTPFGKETMARLR